MHNADNMPLREISYDRESAIAYAHKWAYKRNPSYYDFSNMGGDCTNFISQCVYAGCKSMNFTPTYGWYYISLNKRAPAWTSVSNLYRFLTTNQSVGPYAIDTDISMIQAGDLAQIRFIGSLNFNHTLIIVNVQEVKTLENIKIACHSYDSDFRPLSTYENVAQTRFLHIQGARN